MEIPGNKKVVRVVGGRKRKQVSIVVLTPKRDLEFNLLAKSIQQKMPKLTNLTDGNIL